MPRGDSGEALPAYGSTAYAPGWLRGLVFWALLSATSASPTRPARTIAFVTGGQVRLACA